MKAIMIEASITKPMILCTTCGIVTAKVLVKAGDSLRGIFKRKYKGKRKRIKPTKTWGRTIKPSEYKTTTFQNRKCRKKEIFFAYVMMDCIKKKHKLSIRKKPFSNKLVSKIK